MNSFNTIGRLTRDPETRYTPTGKAITSFDIAQDVGFGDNKKTIFWPCKLWGERGETFAKYVFKGHQIGIEASIDQEEWTDKANGEQRKKLVLNVSNFTLLSNGEKGQQSSTEKRTVQPRPTPRPAPQDDFGEGPITDGSDTDDIPF
jgi:single-strand DNA-binding protein